MKVVSLFDGISCARVALKRARIPVSEYYASEIDPYAITISNLRFPDIKHIGDIRNITRSSFPHLFNKSVDLLIGGSPCQDLSIAKKDRKGLDGERSGLFWEYSRILKEMKPKYFILENVASMSSVAKAVISAELGVDPIMIDATLVSAQRRKRLFWTNIPNIEQPKDRGIFLKDILEDGVSEDKARTLCSSDYKGVTEKDYFRKGRRNLVFRDDAIFQYRRTYWRETKGGKVPTLTANNMGTGGRNVPYIEQRARGKNLGGKHAKKSPTVSASSFEHNNILVDGKYRRMLYPVECERLQCMPDGYTEGVSNTQRYKAIGNGFNVEVIRHILKHIK